MGNGLEKFPYNKEFEETPDSYVIRLFMPGLESKDIKTKIKEAYEGTSVEISAIKSHRREVNDEKIGFYAREEEGVKLTRTFGLEKRVNANQTKTKYMNGIFEVIIPKQKAG